MGFFALIATALSVPVNGDLLIPATGALEARVLNPSLAQVVKVTDEGVVVRGRAPGETSVLVFGPEGQKEFSLRITGEERVPPTSLPAQRAEAGGELEPFPLEVFLGMPEVRMVAKKESTPPPVSSSPPLRLSLFTDKERALPDERVRMEISLVAPQGAREVEVLLPIPEDAAYVLGTASDGGGFDTKRKAVVWKVKDLPPGTEKKLSCEVVVNKAEGEVAFKALAFLEGSSSRVESDPVSVKVGPGRPVLAAIWAIPDTFMVKRNIFSPLSDVKDEGDRRIIERLEGLGIIHGYPDRTFKPRRLTTRAEATKMVVLVRDIQGMADSTRISFLLSRPADVTLSIRDAEGRLVCTLISGRHLEEGQYEVTWDGRDAQGVFVAPGVYRYEVVARSKEGGSVRLASELTLVAARASKPRPRPSFRDVPLREWYAGYVAEAKEKGIVKGYPDKTFKPNKPILRTELAAMLVRAAGLEEEAERRKGTTLGLVDERKVPKWARGYVAVATSRFLRSRGRPIMEPEAGAFHPLSPTERMATAAVVERFLDREMERVITVSGAVSPGTRISVNGRRARINERGRFKEEVRLKPGLNVVTVFVR